jgi:Xaa-Pro aminopeptidase
MGNYRPNRRQSEQLQAALEATGCRIVDATAILRRARRAKSPLELECGPRRAAHWITEVGMHAAVHHLRPGVSELEVHAGIVAAMARAGGEPTAIPIPVSAGAKSACAWHALLSRRRLEHGQVVNVDVCGVLHRYHANLARSFSLGAPHRRWPTTLERMAGGFDVVADLVRPGLAAGVLVDHLTGYYRTSACGTTSMGRRLRARPSLPAGTGWGSSSTNPAWTTPQRRSSPATWSTARPASTYPSTPVWRC